MNIGVQALRVEGSRLQFAIVKTCGKSKCGTMPAEIHLMTYEPGKPAKAIAKGYFILSESEKYLYDKPKKTTISEKQQFICKDCCLRTLQDSASNSKKG